MISSNLAGNCQSGFQIARRAVCAEIIGTSIVSGRARAGARRGPQRGSPAGVLIPPSQPERFSASYCLRQGLRGSRRQSTRLNKANLSGWEGGLAPALCIPSNATKAAPAVLVVPADFHFACVNVFPPVCEFFAANVVRRRRHEVIKNDRVLFAPAKCGDSV